LSTPARPARPRVVPAAEQAAELPVECPWLDPGEQGENLQIQDFPTFLILRLANATKGGITRRYLDPFGISLPEWRLLALIARYTKLSFSEVTAGSSMDKGQVSRTLQSIHRKGLVKLNSVTAAERPRSSAISPRIEVSITPKGKSLFQKILPIARQHQLRLINLLSVEERKVFHSVARRLLQQVPVSPDDN
jgi:DNA-binding MarR family transcriptional regulator